MADHAFGQGTGHPQSLPPERHVHRAVLSPGEMAGQRQDLEAAVQQQRVHLHARRVQRFLEHELAHGLARRGPDRSEGVVRRAEIDLLGRSHPVERRGVLRFQAGPEPVQIDRGELSGVDWTGTEPTRGVKRPALVGLAPAVDLQAALRGVGGAVENELHPADLRAVGPVVRVGVVEHQGVVQLHVLHHSRAVLFGQAGRHRHGAVQSPRHDDAPVDQVVADPGRVLG